MSQQSHLGTFDQIIFMKLIEHIKTHGLSSLEKWNISIKPSIVFPELVCLSYDQLKTPKNDVTNDCRGIVINQNTFKVICWPFTRFGDYDPKKNQQFNYDDFRCYEKIDGSLMNVYYYEGQWRVSSKSLADATGRIKSVDMTYAEYFWKVWNQLKYDLPDDRDCTYMFEFKFPSDTQFIVRSTKPTISLLGIRNNKTGIEYDIEQLNVKWKRPYSYKCTFDVLLQKANEIDPIYSEGFVVCDGNFNRMKVKSPIYDLLALTRQYRGDFVADRIAKAENWKRLCQIAKLNVNETETFLEYYPHLKDDYLKIKKAKKKLTNDLFKLSNEIKSLDMKTIGLKYKNHPMKDLMFGLKKCDDVETFISNMQNRTFIDLIK